jgi:hypothetical protein
MPTSGARTTAVRIPSERLVARCMARLGEIPSGPSAWPSASSASLLGHSWPVCRPDFPAHLCADCRYLASVAQNALAQYSGVSHGGRMAGESRRPDHRGTPTTAASRLYDLVFSTGPAELGPHRPALQWRWGSEEVGTMKQTAVVTVAVPAVLAGAVEVATAVYNPSAAPRVSADHDPARGDGLDALRCPHGGRGPSGQFRSSNSAVLLSSPGLMRRRARCWAR